MQTWPGFIAGLISLSLTSSLFGLEFEIQDIAIGREQKIAFMPYVSRSSRYVELLVIETPDLDEREKQLQRLFEEPIRMVSIFRRSGSSWTLRLQKELEMSMDLIDTVRGRHGMRLAGYQNSQVLFLDEQSQDFEPFISSGSMFVGTNWQSSPTIKMFVDLNQDDLDDFLMPGFDGWQVAIQHQEGFHPPQLIGPRPEMNFGETPRYVGYRARTPYLLDENRDGLNDIGFWLDGRFQIYLQDPSGRFATEAVILDPGQNDVLSGYFSVSLGEGTDDQSDSQRVLDEVEDVDGDGLADLIIQKIEGEGIFGLETRYEIYRGKVGSDDHLEFEQSASSILSTGGIQLNSERLDLTGDGRQEFVVTSVDINIGTIISVLLTRSVSVDVSIYQMTGHSFADIRYAKVPSLQKEITVSFDFSKGELFIPAVLSADVTGDGRQDLLVQKGLDTLLVYAGQSSRTLFARKPIKLELSLPRERDGFVVSDLDHDGRDELILHVQNEGVSVLSVIEFSD